MPEDLEKRKNAIAKRLTDLAVEESELLKNRPLDAPHMTWTQYLKRSDEIDAARKKLRDRVRKLCRSR